MTLDDGAHRPRFQFTLATAFYVMTAMAIACAVGVWAGHFPHWTIIPSVFLVAAWVVARRGKAPDLAWGLFTIGWLITLIDLVNCLINSFTFLSAPLLTHEMQARFSLAYGSTIAVPLFLTIPIVHLAMKASNCSCSRASKWMVACALIAFADCTALTIFLMILVGYTWPW